MGFPGSAVVEELASQCRRHGFSPWVGKILWRRKWQPTSGCLSGKSHGQRRLTEESMGSQSCVHGDTPEHLNTHSKGCGAKGSELGWGVRKC